MKLDIALLNSANILIFNILTCLLNKVPCNIEFSESIQIELSYKAPDVHRLEHCIRWVQILLLKLGLKLTKMIFK